jgi:hypothetical protein
MTWNMLHLARMLNDRAGIPGYGNSTHDWNLQQPTTQTWTTDEADSPWLREAAARTKTGTL